jgi:hypothetical protein
MFYYASICFGQGTRNLRTILIFSLVFVSVIPIALPQFISYNRLNNYFTENINNLSQ